MVSSKYFDFDLTKKRFKIESIKLDNIISNMIVKMRTGSLDNVEAIKAIKILNVYCKKKKFSETKVEDLNVNTAASIIINRLQDRKQKLVLQEYDENYESLFEEIEEISEEEYNKIKDLLEEIKNIIDDSDIEQQLKDSLILDISNIIENLSYDMQDIDKTKGQISTFIDKVFVSRVNQDLKEKAIGLANNAFTLCRKVIFSKLPNALEYDFKGSIKLTSSSSDDVEEDIIDIETSDTNCLEHKE